MIHHHTTSIDSRFLPLTSKIEFELPAESVDPESTPLRPPVTQTKDTMQMEQIQSGSLDTLILYICSIQN